MNYKAKYYHCPPVQDIHSTREVRLRSEELFGDKLAYRQFEAQGVEKAISFKCLSKEVEYLGTAMMKRGWKDKHIALITETSIEMIETYIAVTEAVGVIVPIDKELDPKTMAFQLEKAEIDVLFCSEKCLKKWKKASAYTTRIREFVIMRTGLTDPLPAENWIRFQDLIKEGKKALILGDKSFTEAEIDVRKFCTLVFTSGTTGANKGVMLCQDNIWTSGYGARHLVKYLSTDMSVLPANHTYEMVCNIMYAIHEGSTMCINDDLKHVMTNMAHFAPKMTCMVPMMVDLMVRTIKKESEKSGLEGHLKYARTLSGLLRMIHIDLRKVYFYPILNKFGGKLEKIIVGGAPLSQETIDFMDSIGIQILNGYGITECSPLVAVNGDRLHRKGSVGHVLPSNQVRVVNKDENGIGEIEVKGGNVMLGYYKAPEETASVFSEDGWFKTGDLGHLDKDNFLYLTGRLKNLIILSNGKNVSPEEVEEKIQINIPYIKECVVFADKDNTGIYAICYLDPAYCEEHQLTDIEKMYKKVMEDVEVLNKTLPSFKRLSNVEISPHEFEKTTTQKIKRHLVVV